MKPEKTKSKLPVTELLAVTVTKTSGDHRVDIPCKIETTRYTLPLFSYHPQRCGQWKEIERLATHTRSVEEVFFLGRIQAPGMKEKEYKKW